MVNDAGTRRRVAPVSACDMDLVAVTIVQGTYMPIGFLHKFLLTPWMCVIRDVGRIESWRRFGRREAV